MKEKLTALLVVSLGSLDFLSFQPVFCVEQMPRQWAAKRKRSATITARLELIYLLAVSFN